MPQIVPLGGIALIRPTVPNPGIPHLVLDGTEGYIELYYPFNPDNAHIQMNVYPYVNGNGLPDGAPAVVANQWNALSWYPSLPELVYIGWNGTYFFNGMVSDIVLTDTTSGDTVTFDVTSQSTTTEDAASGASYIPSIIFHNIVAGDWITI